MRVVVAMMGASGAAHGVRARELLHELPDVESHLVMSKSAAMTVTQERHSMSGRDIEASGGVVHSPSAIGATIASGFLSVDAVLVAPCSIKTPSAIADG
jgi:flavin prenyltransferase